MAEFPSFIELVQAQSKMDDFGSRMVVEGSVTTLDELTEVHSHVDSMHHVMEVEYQPQAGAFWVRVRPKRP